MLRFLKTSATSPYKSVSADTVLDDRLYHKQEKKLSQHYYKSFTKCVIILQQHFHHQNNLFWKERIFWRENSNSAYLLSNQPLLYASIAWHEFRWLWLWRLFHEFRIDPQLHLDERFVPKPVGHPIMLSRIRIVHHDWL